MEQLGIEGAGVSSKIYFVGILNALATLRIAMPEIVLSC